MHVHMNLQISQKIEIIHTYSFDLAHLCINFQIQISSNEGAVKKTISDTSKLKNLSEISHFCYSYTIMSFDLKFFTEVKLDRKNMYALFQIFCKLC
jgi:hypothetical protein